MQIGHDGNKPQDRLLLHVCCAPCAAYPIFSLKNRFDIVLFFYGPNIYPKEEYLKRLESAKKLSNDLGIQLIESDYDIVLWHEKIKGLECEKEGGLRCSACFEMRIEHTALYAKHNNYRYFGTTLTVSPHKPAKIINLIGKTIANKHGLFFLDEDFKKADGFKKSCELSKEYALYRQKYCGCEYSILNSN